MLRAVAIRLKNKRLCLHRLKQATDEKKNPSAHFCVEGLLFFRGGSMRCFVVIIWVRTPQDIVLFLQLYGFGAQNGLAHSACHVRTSR